MGKEFISKPCKHCPFRLDVTPFLRTERAEELAYAATNPYHSFPCHKTTRHNDEGGIVYSASEKQCAGFLTLQVQETGMNHYGDQGFKPDYMGVYSEAGEMIEAYRHHNESNN